MELPNKEAYIEYDIDYESTSTNSNKMLGGIRVASTTDCDDFGNCYTNNYKYVLQNGTTSSGEILGGTPIYEYSTYHENETQLNGGILTGLRNYRSAKSRVSFTSYQGSPVLYERVEIKKNNGLNGKTVNTYTKGSSNVNPGFPFMTPKNFDFQKGKLKSSEVYANENGISKMVKLVTNNYEVFYPFGSGTNAIKKAYGMVAARHDWRYWYGSNYGGGLFENEPDDYREDYDYHYPQEYLLKNSVTTEYYDSDTLTTTNSFKYDIPYGQLVESDIDESKGEIIRQKIDYPYSISVGANAQLIQQNRLLTPIKTESFKVLTNGTENKLSSQLTYYKNWGNNVVLPEYIRTSKGTNTLEDRIQFQSYYTNGNVKEGSKISGPHVVYIWGYQEKYPIAKIENATFSEIPTATYNDIIAKSNADDSLADENLLRTSLNALRNVTALSDALITTYTYDPLIGVTSITDPKGYTIYYEYDDFGRLIQVKDAAGKILSKNTYHYKDQ